MSYFLCLLTTKHSETVLKQVHKNFGSCVLHSMASSIFIWKFDFILIKKNDLESSLIVVLFLKGKQNKKEKP